MNKLLAASSPASSAVGAFAQAAVLPRWLRRAVPAAAPAAAPAKVGKKAHKAKKMKKAVLPPLPPCCLSTGAPDRWVTVASMLAPAVAINARFWRAFFLASRHSAISPRARPTRFGVNLMRTAPSSRDAAAR